MLYNDTKQLYFIKKHIHILYHYLMKLSEIETVVDGPNIEQAPLKAN